MKHVTATKPITVLLAEDHMIVREGLRTLLDAEGDIQVVGEAETGRQAVELTKKLRPAVIVMDIAMPLLNGLEATRQIRQAVPDTKVLILSAHSDDAYVEQVVALGAVGYLIKQTSAHFLVEAIREVQKGKTYFSPAIAQRLSPPGGVSPGSRETGSRKEPPASVRAKRRSSNSSPKGSPTNRSPPSWASASKPSKNTGRV